MTFRYRDNARGSRVMRLAGVEFLSRFLLHVLPANFVRIRYFGLLANRRRVQNLRRCRELLGAVDVSVPSAGPAVASSGTAEAAPPEDKRPQCPCCERRKLDYVGVLVPVSIGDAAGWAPCPMDTS